MRNAECGVRNVGRGAQNLEAPQSPFIKNKTVCMLSGINPYEACIPFYLYTLRRFISYAPPPSLRTTHFALRIILKRVYQPNDPPFSAGELAVVFPSRIFIPF